MSNLSENKSDSTTSSNISYQDTRKLESEERNGYLKESEGNLTSTLEVEGNNKKEEETNPYLVSQAQ